MALTTHIATTTLTVGQSTATKKITPSTERVQIVLTATKVGTADSQARLTVTDDQNRVKATVTIDNTGVKKASVEQIDSDLFLSVDCLKGSCTVKVEEETGVEGTSQVETDDLAAAAVTDAKLANSAIGLGVGGFTSIADPGNGGTITPPAGGGTFRVPIATAGAETRVMGTPSSVGQVCILEMVTDGGDCTITVAAGWNDDGVTSDVATFNDVGDILVAVATGAAATDWRHLTKKGVGLA